MLHDNARKIGRVEHPGANVTNKIHAAIFD